jgi:diacylglycerol kinase family enzyme
MIQRIATAERQHSPLLPSVHPRGGVAVLLNARAKAVNAGIRRSLAKVVPPEDLFLSHSQEEAAEIADWVVARRYRTVFIGGGDGSFVSWVNRVLEASERRRTRAPRFGMLALGTGNAVAELVGATPGNAVEGLASFLAGKVPGHRQLDLLEFEGRLTPFAGFGVDAAILNDYNWLKERLGGTPLEGLGLGVAGYGLAVALRSAPRTLMERRPAYCEIVNAGREAWRLDGRGRRVGPAIAHGELLYAGPCLMAGASTVPFYGMGMRIFPFAQKARGMMQLRVATDPAVATLLLNIHRIWSGEFEHEKLLDFQVDRVSLRFERPMPLQVGGDAEGWRQEATFGMARTPIELIDFGGAAS